MRLLVGLAMLCGASGAARAERSITVDLDAGAPFAVRDLEEAIRVRLPAQGAPVRIRITATPSGVQVEARGVVREVALLGLDGPTATRLVALAANDLLLDDLATTPELELRPPSESRVIAVLPRASVTTIGMLGAVSGWDGVLGGATLDVAVPVGRWLAAIDLGGGALVGGPVDLMAGVIRLGGGMRAGWFELRVGATFAPVVVSNGNGDRTVLAGGGTSARMRLPIGSGIRAVLAGGVDVFATRTSYLVDGMPTMSTPRVAPWVAAGMEIAL